MRPIRTMGRPLFAALITVILSPLLARNARAQSSSENLARANALYKEVEALMLEQSFSAACPKLEEIIRLVPEGVGAKITLAECYEGEGRLASAWNSYVVAEAAAEAAGQAERQKKAHDRAAALEPALPLLMIEVPPEATTIKGLVVLRDGTIVPAGIWGTKVPVDPGAHSIVASAPGYAPWSSRVTAVREKLAVVNVGRLRKDAPARKDAPEGEHGASDSSKSLALIIGGGIVTAVALSVGVGATVAASEKSSDADVQIAMMPKNGCAPPVTPTLQVSCDELRATRENQDSLTNTAVTAFVTGGLAGAVTAVYALWPAPRSRRTATVRPVPVVTGTEGGLRVMGAF